MGKMTSLHPLLDKLDEEGTKIISFGSWRAWYVLKYGILLHCEFNTKQYCFITCLNGFSIGREGNLSSKFGTHH